jgi:hypothetical protein
MFQTRRSRLVHDHLQVLLDWGNPSCYGGSGTTFLNLIDHSRNNGYLKNNVTYSPTNGGIVTTGGYNSGAIYTIGDRIDINTSSGGIDRFDGNENFSIFFWVKQYTSGRIFSTGSSGALTGDNDQCIWQLWLTTDRFFYWDVNGGAINCMDVSGNLHTLNTWQHVGFTYSANEGGNNIARCYANGVLTASISVPVAIHSYPLRRNVASLQWTLGGGYYSSCYTQNSPCSFGQFMLYNKTLTQAEIVQNYKATHLRFL